MFEKAIFSSFFISLLAITNPIGNIAIFLSLTEGRTTSEQRKIAIKASIAVLVTLLASLWFGSGLLSAFGISIPAFEAAGGLVILLIGLSMLHGKLSPARYTEGEHEDDMERDGIAIVPLAIPIIAGPGAMTAVIIMAKHLDSIALKIRVSGVLGIVAVIIGLALYFAPLLGRLLGESGMKIVSRIMGLILMAIAMTMIASGLGELFPGWMH